MIWRLVLLIVLSGWAGAFLTSVFKDAMCISEIVAAMDSSDAARQKVESKVLYLETLVDQQRAQLKSCGRGFGVEGTK